jgi:hypothetical protein
MIIIEYAGGTKGDFLSNFLCGTNNISHNGASQPTDNFQHILKTIGLRDSSPIDEDAMIDKLFGQLANKTALSCHRTDIFPDKIKKFIQQHRQTYKILYGDKFKKTVQLEGLFKQWTRATEFEHVKSWISTSLHQHLQHMEYWIGVELANLKHDLTDKNRVALLEESLYQDPDNSEYYCNPLAVGLPGTIILNYQDLYIDFNLDNALFEGYDKTLFRQLVAKTWLPETVMAFGKTWKPRDYGYLDF